MEKLNKSEAEWKKQLTQEQYRVAREKGTEAPFSGAYWNTPKQMQGKYHCICCDTELFDSEQKFDAGCGWPSFKAPISADHLEEYTDKSLGMVRTEVLCARCNAHLGHVFPDGPEPNGLRYCINSASLKLATK